MQYPHVDSAFIRSVSMYPVYHITPANAMHNDEKIPDAVTTAGEAAEK
jgi:hypothetical protein